MVLVLRKKSLLVALAASLLACLFLALAVMLWTTLREMPAPHVQTSAAPSAPPKADEAPRYVRLEPLTIKLREDDSDLEQYLFVTLDLRARDLRAYHNLKAYAPQLQYEALKHISTKRASQVATPAGMQALAGELQSRLNGILGESSPASTDSGMEPGSGGQVRTVLFAAFDVRATESSTDQSIEVIRIGKAP